MGSPQAMASIRIVQRRMNISSFRVTNQGNLKSPVWSIGGIPSTPVRSDFFKV